MEHITELLNKLTTRLRELARGNAVVAKRVSLGDRHVIPLCELSLGFGGAGGMGEGTDPESGGAGKGTAGGAGGAAKAAPVAVIIVEGGKVRIDTLS